MTPAQTALAWFAGWLAKSSAPEPSPCSSARPVKRTFFGKPLPNPVEMVVRGQWGELLPWDFAEVPTTDFSPNALPLFVSFEQATNLALPATADLSDPPGQIRPGLRLDHALSKLEDARLALPMPWRSPEDRWPLMAIVGLDDPQEPISGAVARVGAVGVDLDAHPLIAVPLWALSPADRAHVIANRLPFLPS